jgi:hypothetical protein
MTPAVTIEVLDERTKAQEKRIDGMDAKLNRIMWGVIGVLIEGLFLLVKK